MKRLETGSKQVWDKPISLPGNFPFPDRVTSLHVDIRVCHANSLNLLLPDLNLEERHEFILLLFLQITSDWTRRVHMSPCVPIATAKVLWCSDWLRPWLILRLSGSWGRPGTLTASGDQIPRGTLCRLKCFIIPSSFPPLYHSFGMRLHWGDPYLSQTFPLN